MLFTISLFSTLIAPLLLLIAWVLCLWRIKNMLLLGLTVALVGFVLLSSEMRVLLFARNPYAMLTMLTLVCLNILLLSHMQEEDHPYLVSANSVLLVMIGALHGWRLFLWQSGSYFTDESALASAIVAMCLTTLTVSLPVIAWLSRPSRQNGFRWAVGLIGIAIVLSVMASVWLIA